MNYRFLLKRLLPEFVKITLAKALVLCGYKKEHQGIWLISERGNDARDNGFYFFRYLRQNYPEIPCRYIITDDSADRKKVQEWGCIRYRSLEHYAALLLADNLISTHIMGYTPEPECYLLFEKYHIFRLKGKQIFLQHGIIKDDIEGLKYPNVRVDLFVCGARREYEYVKKMYRHPDGVVQYTGLARYDTLKNISGKRMILIMPTWRKFLNDFTDREFICSEYYMRWSRILRHPKVQTMLENSQYNMVFYPHYEVQRFLHLFQNINPAVRLGSIAEDDVQNLLREADMLITDYSSVYFDAAYMNKPILFYQFDRERFFREHYAKGYFEEKTFGKVLKEEADLIYEIESFLKNEDGDHPYIAKQRSFFGDLKEGSCERIYRAIKALDACE